MCAIIFAVLFILRPMCKTFLILRFYFDSVLVCLNIMQLLYVLSVCSVEGAVCLEGNVLVFGFRREGC